jgi:hypothetical protein
MSETKSCPFCGKEDCEPCTDEHDNPVNFPGHGFVYFCEGCKHHFDKRDKKNFNRGRTFRQQLRALAQAET